MFANDACFSTVTAILPSHVSRKVTDAIVAADGASALMWRARGTLLQDRWWQRLVPPISPAKSMLHMLVPDNEVETLVNTVVEHARLGQQAVGAVYSNRCEHVYLGSALRARQGEIATARDTKRGQMKDDLSVIYCIVGHALSDRVARAAITAGAHGPIVYYSEGRGLRDRLGWLRITKDHEQSVLMVMAEESQVEELFDAMAKAGEFHLPGRGLMFRLRVDKGMFHLPSRVSHHNYAASMQQIIHAIDHLQGHTHWRDQTVFDVGADGKSTGIAVRRTTDPRLTDQYCLTAVLPRDASQTLMDLMLDNGAPGVTMHHARFTSSSEGEQLAGARVSDEYTMFRCIVDPSSAERVCAAIERDAESADVRDLFVTVNSVPRVARYVPGAHDYRRDTTQDARMETVCG